MELPRALFIIAVVLAASSTCAQPWPAKPVRVVVPFPPGASNDVIARITAQKMGEALGQTFVIDNRGGAGGAIGAEIVARSPADGYTLLLTSTSFTTNAAITAQPAFDALVDITGLAMIGTAPMLVTTNTALPAASIRELLALAKSQPGKINYASSGNGSAVHLATEVFLGDAGIRMTHVPYKGLGPALNDMISGQVQVLIASLPSTLPQVKAKRLRALAVTSTQRSAFVPELATVSESGVPGYESALWWGVLAPAKVPAAVSERVNAEVRRLLSTDDVRQRLAHEGAEPAPLSARDFNLHLAKELAKWHKVVKTGSVKTE